MQTVYGRIEQKPGSGRTARRRAGRKKGAAVLGRREKRRLFQLFVCVVLFAAVLVGKGVFPERMVSWKEKALEVLQTDTDFKAAFVGLGQSISEGEPVLETLGDLWIEVFGGKGDGAKQTKSSIETPAYQQERLLLSSQDTGAALMEKRLGVSVQNTQEADQTGNKTAGWGADQDVSQPALLGTQAQTDYDGPALPAGCTMNRLQLKLDATVTPVMGLISSGYGFRIHPVDGEEKFHYGVDIAADEGTPIKAFADGVVDYVGESPVYGKYLQLEHAGGVTTFYAHCSKLCIKKGQKVTAGQTVAKVGQTGNATGPHLHFELKLNGIFLNPIYYIQTLQAS